MAGVGFSANVSAIAITSTAKTVLQLVAASNHGVTLDEIAVTFKGGIPTTDGILVELITQTTAGTMSSLTLVKEPPTAAETLQTTAQHTATVEPTTTTVREQFYVQPQDGFYWAALKPEFAIKIDGGTRWAIRLTAPSALTCAVTVRGKE